MQTLHEKICLIIPCYNEEKRLEMDKFKAFDPNCSFIFVDDGSQDKTLALLNEHRSSNVYILSLQKNSGKAEAVRQGMLYARTLPMFNEISWIGYWDADLSTPLEELSSFLIYSSVFHPDADAVWGSRVRRLGGNIDRLNKRHILGRIFANVTSFFLKLKCYDSQCGSKLFRKELLDVTFNEPFISRWIFDVEIILRLHGYTIVEYPLNYWKDITGSKIKMLPVAYRTLIEIFRIRKRYLK